MPFITFSTLLFSTWLCPFYMEQEWWTGEIIALFMLFKETYLALFIQYDVECTFVIYTLKYMNVYFFYIYFSEIFYMEFMKMSMNYFWYDHRSLLFILLLKWTKFIDLHTFIQLCLLDIYRTLVIIRKYKFIMHYKLLYT